MGIISLTIFIILIVVFALVSEVLIFIGKFTIPVSIVIWGLVLFISYKISQGEKEAKQKAQTMAAPLAFLPCYAFLLSAIPSIFDGDPLTIFIRVLVQLPLSLLCALGFGVGSTAIASKLDAEFIVPAALGLNILSSVFLVSLGI